MVPTPSISCVYCISVWDCCSNPDLYFVFLGHSSCTCFVFNLGRILPDLFHHIFFFALMNLVLPKRWSAINPICRWEPQYRKMKTNFPKAFRGKISKRSGPGTQNCLKVAWRMCRYIVYFREQGTQVSWLGRCPHQQAVASKCVLKSYLCGTLACSHLSKAQTITFSWRSLRGLLLDDTLEKVLDSKFRVRIWDLSVLFLAPHEQIPAHGGALLGEKCLKHLRS